MEEKPKPTIRNSSVELLRIIAMLFIIASHFSVHSGFDLGLISQGNPFGAIVLRMSVLGYIGIDIFMCICRQPSETAVEDIIPGQGKT